ncbi:sensor domain-containing protein [Tessaracoccus lubricantis]|uniref:histidine kinase n=1 Tax=Tessaracoccus lubricantis TaxID=545543 RepID=A0ABP9F9Y1_9ACTN
MTLSPLMRSLRRLVRESAYLLGGFPLAVAAFVAGVTLFSLGVSTIIIWVGLPILAFGLVSASGFAAVERALASRATGRPFPTPAYLRAPAGSSPLRAMFAILRDPQRWLDLLWSVLHFVVSTLTFSLTVTWWAAALWVPFGWLVNMLLVTWIPDIGPNIGGLVGAQGRLISNVIEYAVAIVCLATLPFVVRGLATLQSTISHALLSMRGGYEARIDDLRDSRSAAVRAESSSLSRLERDIHDGPQQRLIRLQMDLARAERASTTDPERARALLSEARTQTAETLAELRNLSRGIAPPVLVDRGLNAALEELAARSEVLTTVDGAAGNLPEHIARTAYFVVAEALTNVNKHSLATHATVSVQRVADAVVVTVTDDGMGGAALAKGHGLSGLAERLRGVDGELTVTSPMGGPTVVEAWLPCA